MVLSLCLVYCGACGQTIDNERMLKAIAHVESSHCSTAVGDEVKSAKGHAVVVRKGKFYLAYGEFQNHLARWIEGGGTAKNWRTASKKLQWKVMRKNLARYVSTAPKLKTQEQLIRWGANFHNIGHGDTSRTAYSTKVLKAYRNH